MQSQLPKVSTRLGLVLLESRLGLVWLESRLGSGSYFSENESLGSVSVTKSLGSASKSSVLCTPIDEIYIIITSLLFTELRIWRRLFFLKCEIYKNYY